MSINEHASPARLRIRSGQGDYDVQFFENSSSLAASISTIKDSFILIDETVLRLYEDLLGGIDSSRIHAISATEDNKTLSGVERVASFLQKSAGSRSSTLVVIGGGITQDIGTFTSHIYYRGIPYVYVPTTLLSMSDSCIGAKCGVNLGTYKNQLGFFQSPACVSLWPGFLRTLPARDIRSGFGEVLKLAITAGDESYLWFERAADQHGLDTAWAPEAIERSLTTKRTVIEEDEYEGNIRKTLNYGHTFGHALESVTENEVPHGLAVAWGLDVANFIAAEHGLLNRETYDRIHLTLVKYFSFEVYQPVSASALMNAIGKDKKAASGKIQLILPRGLGRLDIIPTEIDDRLGKCIESYLERDSICASHD